MLKHLVFVGNVNYILASAVPKGEGAKHLVIESHNILCLLSTNYKIDLDRSTTVLNDHRTVITLFKFLMFTLVNGT